MDRETFQVFGIMSMTAEDIIQNLFQLYYSEFLDDVDKNSFAVQVILWKNLLSTLYVFVDFTWFIINLG